MLTLKRTHELRLWVLAALLGTLLGVLTSIKPELAAAGLVALLILILAFLVFSRAPEVLFGLFIYVGAFKLALLPVRAMIGIDLTIMLAGGVIIFTALHISRKTSTRIHWPMLSAYLLLVGWMFFSLIWSPEQVRGLDKAARFASLTLLAFVAPLLLIDSWLRLRRFLWTLLLVGVAFSLGALNNLLTVGELQRLTTIFGADYLGVGQICGLVAGIGVFLLLAQDRRRWYLSLMLAMSIVVAMSVVLLTAARGPLIAWPLAFLLAVLLEKRLNRRAIVILGGLVVAIASLIVGLTSDLIPHVIMFRYEVLFRAFIQGESLPVELVPRLYIWRSAWDMFMEHPLIGNGIAGYAIDISTGHISYAHNIFLEAGTELGLVGVGITLMLVLAPIMIWRRSMAIPQADSSRLLLQAVLWIYLFLMIGVMKSGDLNSNRMFWMSAGLLTSVSMLSLREHRGQIVTGDEHDTLR